MPCSANQCATAVALSILAFCTAGRILGQTVDRIESVNFSPGKSANLTAYGKGLKDAACLWTPFGRLPGKPREEKTKDAITGFEGQIPAAVVPGVYETRVVTKSGVSDSRFLVLDDLPAFRLPNACEVNPPATVLPPACCINGQINPLKTKYWGLQLKKQQSISVEVFARRLNSPLDPVLRLCDSSGTELAFVDDITGLSGDAQLEFTAPEDGRYVLELRDVKYGGGGSHFYHLRIGSFPLVQGTYPRQTHNGPLAFVAEGQADRLTQMESLSAVSKEQSVRQVVDKGAVGSAITSVIPKPQPSELEIEPNNDRDSATLVESPADGIAGRIQESGDVDWFRFQADKKRHFCITALTRELGSPADVILELYNSDAKLLHKSDDVGRMDAQLSALLPSPGDYFLCVHELTQQGGAAWTYDLNIDDTPRPELTSTSDQTGLPQGSTTTIPIQVKRLGSTKPFQLSVSGLPAGITSSPVWVVPRQETAFVALHSSVEATTAFCERLQIEGRLASGKTVPVLFRPVASTPPHQKRLRYQTGIFVYSTAAAAYALSCDTIELSVVPGSQKNIVVTASRSKKWSHPIDVASAVPVKELPIGVTIGNVQIAGQTGELAIQVRQDAKPGSYSISLSGTSKKNKTVVVQALPTIQLEIPQHSSVK